MIAVRQDELQKLQLERQQKEVKLRDLRGADLQALLLNDKRLKQEIETSLEQIGVPAALNSIADLSQVVAEAYTVRGRLTALFLTVLNTKQRVLWVLLPFVMFVIPLIAYLVHEYLIRNDLIVFASTVCSQVVVVLAGIATVLRQAVGQVKANLDRVEAAKQQVDELIADKRKNPTIDELELQKEIASLNAKEQGAASRLSAATARVLELEEHIRSIEEGRSLAWFLSERTRSEDYRKYLGLISTIRRDFESLGERLASARPASGDTFRPVDRIILYIDDLDRCHADKVMDVLQAVHLLLAYPLFVVVVGVNPRWLLHSLGKSYSAFGGDGDHYTSNPDQWRTTPQNYLEKIFQVPFNLRPMNASGYGKLVDGLLMPGILTALERRSHRSRPFRRL